MSDWALRSVYETLPAEPEELELKTISLSVHSPALS